MINIQNELQLMYEFILNDGYLQQLQAKRVEIYSLIVPTVILKEDGVVETVWVDETNHSILSNINILIEHRIKQIENFYALYKGK